MGTKFAAVDDGVCDGTGGSGAVYAVAPTERGAVRIARREAREPAAEFDTVPISDEAAAFVAEHGGAPDDRLLVSRSGVSLDADPDVTEKIREILTDGSWSAANLEVLRSVRSAWAGTVPAEFRAAVVAGVRAVVRDALAQIEATPDAVGVELCDGEIVAVEVADRDDEDAAAE